MTDKTIATQNANIDRLNYENLQMIASIKHLKAEAIKEFAERLKKQAEVYTDFDEDVFRLAVGISKIDNLLKEMVGEDNA